MTSLLILAARLLPLENADQPGQAPLSHEFKDLYLVDPPRIVSQSAMQSPALVLKRNSVGLVFEEASVPYSDGCGGDDAIHLILKILTSPCGGNLHLLPFDRHPDFDGPRMSWNPRN